MHEGVESGATGRGCSVNFIQEASSDSTPSWVTRTWMNGYHHFTECQDKELENFAQ